MELDVYDPALVARILHLSSQCRILGLDLCSSEGVLTTVLLKGVCVGSDGSELSLTLHAHESLGIEGRLWMVMIYLSTYLFVTM